MANLCSSTIYLHSSVITHEQFETWIKHGFTLGEAGSENQKVVASPFLQDEPLNVSSNKYLGTRTGDIMIADGTVKWELSNEYINDLSLSLRQRIDPNAIIYTIENEEQQIELVLNIVSKGANARYTFDIQKEWMKQGVDMDDPYTNPDPMHQAMDQIEERATSLAHDFIDNVYDKLN